MLRRTQDSLCQTNHGFYLLQKELLRELTRIGSD
jgi:hypothetical protein